MKNKKTYFIILMILIVIRVMGFYLEAAHNYYFISAWVVFFINALILIFFKLYFKPKSKILNILLHIIIIILLFINLFIYMFTAESANTYIQSPQKTNTLIITENQLLAAATYTTIYERKMLIFKKKISEEDIGTGDASMPFQSNNYKVNWLNENEAEIYYPYRSHMDESEWRYVKINI